MKRRYGGAFAPVLAAAMAASAHAQCKVNQIAELPVTMSGMGPMIDAKINGTPVRFLADSGAFYSIISPGNAQSLHLSATSIGPGAYMRGINGTASMGVARVNTFTLAGADVHGVDFVVGGSETGGVGVIGQNIWGLGDVEYDLPHGMIRLMKSQSCDKANLAYWASDRPYSFIPIEERSPQKPHTVGTVLINGQKIRATFDTGASTTILSLQAAARAGIKPDSPGVTDGGMAWGFGRKLVRTWIAPLQTLMIGDGEKIEHARVRIGAMDVDTDMLIGADFFIAHRVYVDNRAHRLFLTYEGGPMFNLKTRFEGANGQPEPSPPVGGGASAAPTSAEGYDRAGAIAAARRDWETALTDFSKAVTIAPGDPRYLMHRAGAYSEQGKKDLAQADIDQAIKLDPHNLDALIGRAEWRLKAGDKAGAIADLDAADHVADPAAMERLALGDLFSEAGAQARAIASLTLWIKAHPEDVRRPEAMNGRCWARALAGQDLPAALGDCNAALRSRPGRTDILDSRGLVYLRLGQTAKAIADYDMVLAKEPKQPWSLYGRGIAKLRGGDKAGGQADMAAAVAIQPQIAEEARGYGITP